MVNVKYIMIRAIRWAAKILSYIAIPLVYVIAFIARFTKRKYDIGLGPVPMINNVYLKKSLESQGYVAETYVTGVYHITNDFDYIMQSPFFTLSPFCKLFPILFKYKCIYIYFDGGILANKGFYRYLEASIYKVAGIKIVVMPYGADCFIPERCPNIYFKNAEFCDYASSRKRNHDKVVWQVNYWCKKADAVIAAGDDIDYLHYWDWVRASYLSVNLDKLTPRTDFKFHIGDIVKILHAPNHTSIKGSEFIEQAIHQLQNEGYLIQYCCIQKRPNEEVLVALQEADIVVDQLILGWHGMFALEAMAFGKPVITHIRPDLLKAYEEMGCLEKNELPLIDATPTTIYTVLKDLLDNPQTWKTIGKKSRAYVEKYHSIEVVGKYFDKINRSIGMMPTHVEV